MGCKKIGVTAYAGYRSGEAPRSFVLEGKTICIADVISRWVGENEADKVQRRFFRVKGDDGFIYLLSFDEQTGDWYLE